MNRQSFGDNALLTGALGAALISTSAVLVKLADLPATTTAVLRTGYAVPVLVLLGLWEQRRHGPRDRRQLPGCLLAGVLFGCATLSQNFAIAAIGAGIATVVCNLQVLVVAVGAWWCFAERPPRRLLLALPPALLGVVMVAGVLGGQATGPNPTLGVLAGLANSLCYGGFLLVLRRTRRFGGGHTVATLRDVTAVACLVSLVAMVVSGEGGLLPSWPAHGWMLLLALGPQVIGWLIITTNLPKLPLAVSGLLLLLQPMLTMVLAMVLLAEQPSIMQLTGCVLLLAAVGFGAWKPKRPPDVTTVDHPQEDGVALAAGRLCGNYARFVHDDSVPADSSWRRAMLPSRRRFAAAIITLGVATAATLSYASTAMAEEKPACPEVFAHGGYPADQDNWDKEQVRQANNPKALKHYKDTGAAGVEADLQLTREGTKAVMWHNHTTNNLSGAQAPITDLWWDSGGDKVNGRTVAVGPFKGEKVQTLRQYLDAAHDTKMVPLIEVKNYDNTPLLSSDDKIRDRAWGEVVEPVKEKAERQEIMVYTHDDKLDPELKKRFEDAGLGDVIAMDGRPVWPDSVDWDEPPPDWNGNADAWQAALDKGPNRMATDWPAEMRDWLKDKCG